MVKIQAVNGLRVEIFLRKYYPFIDILDRRNGNRSASIIRKLYFID